jgi:hypothetical protein
MIFATIWILKPKCLHILYPVEKQFLTKELTDFFIIAMIHLLSISGWMTFQLILHKLKPARMKRFIVIYLIISDVLMLFLSMIFLLERTFNLKLNSWIQSNMDDHTTIFHIQGLLFIFCLYNILVAFCGSIYLFFKRKNLLLAFVTLLVIMIFITMGRQIGDAF